MSPGGVLPVFMTGGGPTELDIANPKKHEPEILHPKKLPLIKILYPKKDKT